MLVTERFLYILLSIIVVLGTTNIFFCIHQTSNRGKKNKHKKNSTADE